MKTRISKSIRNIFLEAYRRNEILLLSPIESCKPLTERWLGLGPKSTYKPTINAGLMKYVKIPEKRTSGWLVLTKKGEELFNSIKNDLKKRTQ